MKINSNTQLSLQSSKILNKKCDTPKKPLSFKGYIRFAFDEQAQSDKIPVEKYYKKFSEDLHKSPLFKKMIDFIHTKGAEMAKELKPDTKINVYHWSYGEEPTLVMRTKDERDMLWRFPKYKSKDVRVVKADIDGKDVKLTWKEKIMFREFKKNFAELINLIKKKEFVPLTQKLDLDRLERIEAVNKELDNIHNEDKVLKKQIDNLLEKGVEK